MTYTKSELSLLSFIAGGHASCYNLYTWNADKVPLAAKGYQRGQRNNFQLRAKLMNIDEALLTD